MKALDAAVAVLNEAGEPLHYREITRRMLALGLWTTTGKTPWVTVNARIAVEIRGRGTASRFVRVAPGRFALNPDAVIPPVEDASVSPPPVGDDGGGHLSFRDAAEQILQGVPEARAHPLQRSHQAGARTRPDPHGGTHARRLDVLDDPDGDPTA